ncbi:hypothetical protein [Burkholderia sp. S171]|nr:hypothetical protein [Burkholderia sp. S171]
MSTHRHCKQYGGCALRARGTGNDDDLARCEAPAQQSSAGVTVVAGSNV